MELEEGKTYTLHAVDIATDTSGRDYIEAYDEFDNLFRIYNLMNCQRNELSKSIQCIARKNPKNNRLYMVQDNAYYYRKAYDEGHYYQFRVKDIETEGVKHYMIEDNVDIYFYPFSNEPEYEIGEDIILEVSKITDDGKVFFERHQENVSTDQKQEVNPVIAEEACADATENKVLQNAPMLTLPEENSSLELKTSLVFTADGKCDVALQTYKIIRVLASFMNTQGGTLYIGIHDKTHKVVGIEHDFEYLDDNQDDEFTYQKDEDGYQNLIRNRLSALCQGVAQQLTTVEFPKEQGVKYCKITVRKAHRPIWVNGNQLWVRDGNSTRQRRGDDISFFIAQFDIFDQHSGTSMTQEEMEKAMRNVLNRDFAKTDSTDKSGEVAYYITWYKNRTYKKTRNEGNGENVLYSLPVYKNVKDGGGVVLFCYDNGKVNKVEITSLMKRMNLNDNPKPNAFSDRANLLQIYITLPSNILAVLSTNEHGTQNVKAHEITHINATQGGGNQGSIFVPSPCTNLQYKLIDAVHKHEIENLIFPKNQTSNTAGCPVTSPTYSGEIERLLKL